MGIFLLSFKTKAVSCGNIQITLAKTFISKCDINFFKMRIPPHSYLLGNFSIIPGIVPDIHLQWWWYLSSVLVISYKLKKQSTWRCSGKKFSLYIRRAPRKLKVFTNWTWFPFSVEVLKFCQLRGPDSFIQQSFSTWWKVKCMKNILKCRPMAYLEPCQRFCENMSSFVKINDFF